MKRHAREQAEHDARWRRATKSAASGEEKRGGGPPAGRRPRPLAMQDINRPKHEVRLNVSRAHVKSSPSRDAMAAIELISEKQLHTDDN